MADMLRTISPVDGRVYVERPLTSGPQVDATLTAARRAQAEWKRVPIAERAALCTHFVDAFVAHAGEIASEISWQMGRPVSQSPGEVRGLAERARYMSAIAEESLADVAVGEKAGFSRFIRRESLGVVLTVAPWNYPYLTAVNSVVPAILAGNAVILRHSAQTPLCAERFAEAFTEAGLPTGVFQALHCSHAEVERLIGNPGIDHVVFTGSVDGGHVIQRAAARRFIGVGLELGGKDPGYGRPDADLSQAIPSPVGGG